ncbi:MAG: DinB family protein [Fimbriimonadaceae bacterium]|nr:DinB family protein [Fimbriimonadaceae bacterium]
MLSPYIFIGLEKNMSLYARLAGAVPADRLDVPTGVGRFTARQALAHWADWEAIHLSRIEAALGQDGAEVPDYDEGARCVEQNYDAWDVASMMQKFATERAQLTVRLKGLSEEQLEQRFAHSHFGKLSVADYAGHILGHDAYHVEQLVGVCSPS